MPSELLGVWRTDETKYRDRYLDIDKKFVVFGAGEEEHPQVQKIERISATLHDQATEYTVYSHDADGSESKLTFDYTPNNGGEIRLSNPKTAVWKKAGFN